MHKIFLLLVFVFAVSGSNLFAAPAAPIETKVSQPDGSTFMVRARGDEHSNWVETTDGHTVIKVDDIWFYAKRDGNGGIEASNDPVGSLDATQLQQLPLHLAPPRDPSASEPRKIRKLQRPGATATRGPDQAAAQTEAQAVFHTQYVLTILVDYSDIVVTYSDASFAELIYGANNSVKDFFWENSYNRFTFAAPVESFGTADDGIIHVTRPGAHPNQGSNNLVSRVEAQQIVQLADDFIDFASYDASGNGSVSAYELAIVIITAGYETSYSGSGVSEIPSVWGHADSFPVLTLDGKAVFRYTMFGERHGPTSDEHQATIGIMSHELGHLMLDLPDLYDTKDDVTSEGIGEWGLMGTGIWNSVGTYIGETPSHLSAWSKVATNFTIPQDIDFDEAAVSIAQAETIEDTKRLWVDRYKSDLSQEYFLVENRQQTGYDAGLPGEGLLIWHIDEGQVSNEDENHKRVDLEEADGLNDLDNQSNRGDGADSFPGTLPNFTFDNASNPNSKNYAGANTGIAVTSISAPGAVMTANFTSLAGGVGDHVRYDESGSLSSASLGSTTAWLGIRALNDTSYSMFDGVDVYVNDTVGATIDIYYYDSMAGGAPVGLIHSETGIATGPNWVRLLLATPQPFPVGAERGIVIKVVNAGSEGPVVYDSVGAASG